MEITCPQCGFSKDIPEDKIPANAQIATCPKCKHKFKFRDIEQSTKEETREDIGAENTESEDIWASLEKLNSENEKYSLAESSDDNQQGQSTRATYSIPWEELEQKGFFAGFFDTIKMVCLSPKEFFKSMTTRGGYTRPLIFYLLISEFYTAFRMIWSLAGVGVMEHGQQMDILNLGLHGMASLLWLLFYPILLTVLLFMAAGINHLCLMLVKDGSRGFKGTFKVLCYSSAPMIMSLFPILGPIIGILWSSVCNFLGYKYVHKTSGIKVAIAMLIPVLIISLLSMPMALRMKGM